MSARRDARRVVTGPGRSIVGASAVLALWCGAAAAQTQPKSYSADWTSLDQHPPAPEWFKDAKLGVWFHWGAHTTPQFYGEWYPHYMYDKSNGGGVYQHHLSTYGDPFANWPYDKFITGANDKNGNFIQFAPKLVSAGGKWDPDAWAQLFVNAGARIVGVQMEHHDGFALWDSKVNEWNSLSKGPKLNLAKLHVDAYRKKGLKIMAAFHHAYNFQGYWQNVPPQTDPGLQKLYGQLSAAAENQLWLDELKEVVDEFQPDMVYQDSFTPQIVLTSATLMQFAAYYYNAALSWNKEVVETYKDGYDNKGEVYDYERGGPADITNPYWATDDTVGPNTWGYVVGMTYYTPAAIIHQFIDRVSKNGNLLLNVCPMADGTIPVEQQNILMAMGTFLKQMGTAIYATRAWQVYGEGPTKMGGCSICAPTAGTAQDIRYTASKDGDALYAIVLGWPGNSKQVTMTAVTSGRFALGSGKVFLFAPLGGAPITLQAAQDSAGLHVTLPSTQPYTAVAYAMKISKSGTIPDPTPWLDVGGAAGASGGAGAGGEAGSGGRNAGAGGVGGAGGAAGSAGASAGTGGGAGAAAGGQPGTGGALTGAGGTGGGSGGKAGVGGSGGSIGTGGRAGESGASGKPETGSSGCSCDAGAAGATAAGATAGDREVAMLLLLAALAARSRRARASRSPARARLARRAGILPALAVMFTCAGASAAPKPLIEYFRPTPIIGTLTTSGWGIGTSGPRDPENGIEDIANWRYWDGKIIKAPDGTYHLFCSKWPASDGIDGWLSDSVSVHATSKNALGPYKEVGLTYTYQNGRGHNTTGLTLTDGTYAVLESAIVPGWIFTSATLAGPFTYQGSMNWNGNGYNPQNVTSNLQIAVGGDNRYWAIGGSGFVLTSDKLLGTFQAVGPSVYPTIAGTDKGKAEDPVIWYSGGYYHVVYNYWDIRRSYHIMSADGIHNWTSTGVAVDRTTDTFRYTDGTVNHWGNMERPDVYMENGHVAYFTFAVTDQNKDQSNNCCSSGSKVIVVPFDGVSFDADNGGMGGFGTGGAAGAGGAGGAGGAAGAGGGAQAGGRGGAAGGTGAGGAGGNSSGAAGGVAGAGGSSAGGAPGAGGAVSSGTGGTSVSGTGGVSSSGGAPGTGGHGGTMAGSTGGAIHDTGSSSGCSCRSGGNGPGSSNYAALLSALALVSWSRRRTKQRSAANRPNGSHR